MARRRSKNVQNIKYDVLAELTPLRVLFNFHPPGVAIR